MIKRTISTLALWAILIAAIYFAKGYGFGILIYILAILASYEACKLLEKCSCKPSFKAVALAETVLFGVVFFACSQRKAPVETLVLLDIFFTIIAFSLWLLKSPFSDMLKVRIIPSFAVFIMVGLMLSVYVMISFASPDCGDFSGVIMACWAIATAKFSDIGGYLIGSKMGKHKLAPKISPKKTWEGAVGGVIFSVIASYLILYFFKPEFSGFLLNADLSILTIVAAPILAIVALISDLLESVLKRRANIKDSGATIPGIGGALDLADSMLLTAPVSLLFLFIIVFIN